MPDSVRAVASRKGRLRFGRQIESNGDSRPAVCIHHQYVLPDDGVAKVLQHCPVPLALCLHHRKRGSKVPSIILRRHDHGCTQGGEGLRFGRMGE